MRTVALTDFAPSNGDDWYAPLKAALSFLTAVGGGRLVVPKRIARYDCNVTSAIQITSNDITIELEPGAVLQNSSASGVDFFQFAGATGARSRVNLRGGRVQSAATAGHIFTFADDVGLGLADWTSEIVQLNPCKSIIKGSPWTSSGMFSNRFGGPQWEHGSGSRPSTGLPSVPAVDIATSTNAFNANAFVMLRVNAHHNTAPFFSFLNNGPSPGAFYSHNHVAVPTVEQVRRGFVKAHGALGLVVRDCGFYDSKTIDGHVIETGTGDGGRDCEQCRFEDIDFVSVIRGGDGVVGVTGTSRSVSSLTRSGSTATAIAHGFAVGQRVYIKGANQREYNGRFTVTWASEDATTFTYEVAGRPATPATGTITAEVAAMTVFVGSGDARHTFVNVGGNTTSKVEVDLNDRGAIVIGDHEKVGYFRASATLTTLVRGGGAESAVETPTVLASTIDERTAEAGLTLLGQNIKEILSFTAAVDLPNIAAGASALVKATATGVKTGDRLIFHPDLNGPGPGAPTATADLVVGLPWIPTDDQISFIVHNVSGGAVDASNHMWHGMVFRP